MTFRKMLKQAISFKDMRIVYAASPSGIASPTGGHAQQRPAAAQRQQLLPLRRPAIQPGAQLAQAWEVAAGWEPSAESAHDCGNAAAAAAHAPAAATHLLAPSAGDPAADVSTSMGMRMSTSTILLGSNALQRSGGSTKVRPACLPALLPAALARGSLHSTRAASRRQPPSSLAHLPTHPQVAVEKNKLVIVMVGLPGRGKTFLCNKLKCYLNCGSPGQHAHAPA